MGSRSGGTKGTRLFLGHDVSDLVLETVEQSWRRQSLGWATLAARKPEELFALSMSVEKQAKALCVHAAVLETAGTKEMLRS